MRAMHSGLVTLLAIALSACQINGAYSSKEPTATTQTISAEAGQAVTIASQQPPGYSRDRAAILAMVGEYDIDFQFQETLALQTGYQLKAPYTAGGTEFVTVVVDEPNLISLQHILVMGGGYVVKHWRQDWHYQNDTVYRYVGPMDGKQTWQRETLPWHQVAGTWTQTVWQVDDSPRYQSVGRWLHQGNLSQWEGDRSARPLPRREYTKRDDYHVLVAVNRQTITPTGWVHEQDNYKQTFDNVEQPILAREVGLNVYNRISTHDFSPGYDYWNKTQAFWADVRQWWENRMSLSGSNQATLVMLQVEVNAQPLYKRLFALAQEVAATPGDYQADRWPAQIDQILQEHTAFTY